MTKMAMSGERWGNLCHCLTHRIGVLCFGASLLWAVPSAGQTITGLTIEGSTSSGIVGEFPLTSQFSWFHNVLAEPGHSWMFGGGSMGGIVFSVGQTQGQMGGWYTMYNQPAVLFSVTGGITIDGNNTIDMSALRLSQAGTIYDLGSGSGYDTFVPLVSDINLLGAGQNGWMINPDGSYYLVYNSVGTSPTSTSAMHLYGYVQAVPLPGALMCLASGILALSSFTRRRRRLTNLSPSSFDGKWRNEE